MEKLATRPSEANGHRKLTLEALEPRIAPAVVPPQGAAGVDTALGTAAGGTAAGGVLNGLTALPT
jgi:hypothetical protein